MHPLTKKPSATREQWQMYHREGLKTCHGGFLEALRELADKENSEAHRAFVARDHAAFGKAMMEAIDHELDVIAESMTDHTMEGFSA